MLILALVTKRRTMLAKIDNEVLVFQPIFMHVVACRKYVFQTYIVLLMQIPLGGYAICGKHSEGNVKAIILLEHEIHPMFLLPHTTICEYIKTSEYVIVSLLFLEKGKKEINIKKQIHTTRIVVDMPIRRCYSCVSQIEDQIKTAR
ncbi:hypothetical protein ACJX0J_027349, partial [Zea mays]